MFTVWHLILNLTLLISLNLGRRKADKKKHKLLLNRRHMKVVHCRRKDCYCSFNLEMFAN